MTAPLLPKDVPQPVVGIIGGSGLYSGSSALQTITTIQREELHTPFGLPSSAITISKTSNGTIVAFLARHGLAHSFTPSYVPVRANLSALKLVGCEAIITFSAVGSLQEDLRPGEFVLPDHVIDRTFARTEESTIFGNDMVGHVPMAEPFSKHLRSLLQQAAKQSVPQLTIHTEKTVITIEGPRFSTRAESHLYRQWKCDVINMSACPEVFIARELELPYQMVCMVTDYDCWKEDEEGVSVDKVMSVMRGNGDMAAQLMVAIVDLVGREHATSGPIWMGMRKEVEGAAKYAVMTKLDARSPAMKERLRLLLPQYHA